MCDTGPCYLIELSDKYSHGWNNTTPAFFFKIQKEYTHKQDHEHGTLSQ